jgi:hypothetical protein
MCDVNDNLAATKMIDVSKIKRHLPKGDFEFFYFALQLERDTLKRESLQSKKRAIKIFESKIFN